MVKERGIKVIYFHCLLLKFFNKKFILPNFKITLQMVPFKEMPDVLRVIKEHVKLKPGSWVRLKRTIWKDDLAQVEHVDTAQNQVILKLIPRIDYNQKRGHLRDPEQKDEKLNPFKRKTRPPQKLFDYDSVQKIGGMPMKEKENWIFENNRYTPKGFLIKNFPLSTVVSLSNIS